MRGREEEREKKGETERGRAGGREGGREGEGGRKESVYCFQNIFLSGIH
jgi:hypothetical protein